TTLSPVMTTAARTELPAAARFSARINSDEGIAGFPDMQELSPLRAQSAKQIAAFVVVGARSEKGTRSFIVNRRGAKVAACARI
ncbi:MAG: hypothetical protein WAN18_13440, partial [Candidatus Sulfotelmatobacter sp.]